MSQRPRARFMRRSEPQHAQTITLPQASLAGCNQINDLANPEVALAEAGPNHSLAVLGAPDA
jgi:hypothetical protein